MRLERWDRDAEKRQALYTEGESTIHFCKLKGKLCRERGLLTATFLAFPDAEQPREDSRADQQGPGLACLPSHGSVDPVPGHGDTALPSDHLPDPGTPHLEGKLSNSIDALISLVSWGSLVRVSTLSRISAEIAQPVGLSVCSGSFMNMHYDIINSFFLLHLCSVIHSILSLTIFGDGRRAYHNGCHKNFTKYSKGWGHNSVLAHLHIMQGLGPQYHSK